MNRLSGSLLAIAVFILAWMPACNFYYSKQTYSESESLMDIPTEELSWENVNQKIIHPKCLGCHDEYGTYDGVRSDLAGIRDQAVVLKTMPKRGERLSQYERALLAKWIDTGAPEFVTTEPSVSPVPSATPSSLPSPDPSPVPSAAPSPEPSPSPSAPVVTIPLQPTFKSIFDQILVPRCIHCHKPGAKAEKIPLQTLKDLLDSPEELVIPGDPDSSTLVIAITRNRKPMPPASDGPRLSPLEVEAIRAWIKNGAKD